jgi:hypothetical protein
LEHDVEHLVFGAGSPHGWLAAAGVPDGSTAHLIRVETKRGTGQVECPVNLDDVPIGMIQWEMEVVTFVGVDNRLRIGKGVAVVCKQADRFADVIDANEEVEIIEVSLYGLVVNAPADRGSLECHRPDARPSKKRQYPVPLDLEDGCSSASVLK